MGFNTRNKVFDGSNQCMFRKQRGKFDDPNATVDSVWRIIGDYISFFDYDILETIIENLGSDKDKESFAKYREDFEKYAKQRVFKHQISSESSSAEEAIVFVKLDSLYDECDITHLKKLQKKLSDILNLNEGVLQLRKIESGCILLVFKIPDFIYEDIFPLSIDQESALQELGVARLDCGDYHFIVDLKVRLKRYILKEKHVCALTICIWLQGSPH